MMQADRKGPPPVTDAPIDSVQCRKTCQAWVEFLWQSWWGKNVLAVGFHVKIGRFNVDAP